MMWSGFILLLLTVLCPLAHSLRQYHFVNTALSWSKAQTYCRRHYTDLATIFDQEDMNRLVNSAQDSGGFTNTAWIGLFDNLTSWRWSYVASRYYSNVNSNYTNWDYGQPDNFNGEEMCVKMWSGGVWEDSKCFLKNPFICGTNKTSERFVFVEREMSWSAAQKYCRKHHSDLVYIKNKTENLEIQILAKNRSVWIGLYRTRQWSDQSKSTYRNWKAGQPDNVGGQQGCITTDLGNAGLWSDERCSRELTFICYGEENGETPDKDVSTTPTATGATTSVTPKTPMTTGQTSTITAAAGEDSNSSTTEIEEPTTGYSVGTYMTPSEEGSTQEVDPTGPVTDETTLETESSEKPPTPEVDPTPSTPAGRKTEHVINLRVALSSKVQLSEDDIKKLVSVEFHDRLIEMGLPVNIKVGVRKTTKTEG